MSFYCLISPVGFLQKSWEDGVCLSGPHVIIIAPKLSTRKTEPLGINLNQQIIPF